MSDPERLRVAVVGVGHLGRIHARIWTEHPGAELVGVYDVDRTRAEAVAREFQRPVLADLEHVAQAAQAVSVVVPTVQHASVAVPLLERGLACLIEKPLARSAEEARGILAAAERGRAVLTVGHVERFQPGVQKVLDLGLAPRFVECHRLSAFSFRGTDVGVVHDLMIHDLDLLLSLVGSPVESFDAAGGSILTETEDLASVRIVFANGARANATASRVSLSPMRRFRLFSADSYVSLDFTKNYGLLVRKGPDWERRRAELRTLEPSELSRRTDLQDGVLDVQELELAAEPRPLQRELDAFLRAARGERGPVVTGSEALAALELADRISAAIRVQRW